MSEKTDAVQKPHLFQKGQSGNPAGRPKGARNKLGEMFLEGLMKTFSEASALGDAAGLDALRKTRDEDPAAYTRVLASILPKEITGEDGAPLVTGITVTFVRPEPKES